MYYMQWQYTTKWMSFVLKVDIFCAQSGYLSGNMSYISEDLVGRICQGVSYDNSMVC